MPRINDIVFIFSGGVPFASQFPVDREFDLNLWRSAEAGLSYRRNLFHSSRGVDKDVNQNMLSVIATIKGFAHVHTLGQVCLLGRSAGCLLALAVASGLHNEGLKEHTFVGLSDVPMYHDGNQPAVPNVGAIKPKNGPIGSGAKASTSLFKKFGVEPVSEVPRASLDKEITVKEGNKIQLYQIQGNHMTYSFRRSEWVWTSDKTMAGEVHGKLEGGGWDNQFQDVGGVRFNSPDLDFHVGLNTGPHWKGLCSKAARHFANLPPTPQP